MRRGHAEGLLWEWWLFLSVIVRDTPAVVVNRGHLSLGSLCAQTAAAAWCNAADISWKIWRISAITHPHPATTPCSSTSAAAAADTDSGRPPGRGLYFRLLD